MPKISVIVPVYNTEQYLEKCLGSLIAQTLADIEIICVNDGSTDNSGAVLQNFAKKDARIIVINQENLGQSAARNTGIDAAKGEFIGFLDADDWCDLNMFEKLYQNAIRYDSDISMCSITVFDEKSDEYLAHDPYMSLDVFPRNFENTVFSAHEIYDFIFRICVVPWNKIYKREFLRKNNIRFPLNLNYEDNVFCLECLLSSDKTSIVKEPLVVYRMNSEVSYSRSEKHDRKKLDFFKVFKLEEQILKEKGVYQKLKKYFTAHEKDTLVYWYNKIQDSAVRRKYFQKLVMKYPLFLFDNLEKEIKIRITANKLKNILKKQKVVFWGASTFLKDFLTRFDISKSNIVAVVDKSSARFDEEFCGYRIIAPENLKELEFDAVIPATINIYNFDKLLKTELEVLGMDKEVLKIWKR